MTDVKLLLLCFSPDVLRTLYITCQLTRIDGKVICCFLDNFHRLLSYMQKNPRFPIFNYNVR